MRTFVIFTFLVCVLVSCQTAKRVSAPTSTCNLAIQPSLLSRTLLDKQWSETRIEARQHETDSTFKDITDQFMDSDLDDLLLFHSDGTFEFDEGEAKATKKSLQVYGKGYWSVDSATSQLFLCMNDDLTAYNIITLQPEKLILQLVTTQEAEDITYLLTFQAL